MIEKITLRVADESRNSLENPTSELKLQSKLDIWIAERISEINHRQQSIVDDEIRTNEKFRFALGLDNFVKEMKETLCQQQQN